MFGIFKRKPKLSPDTINAKALRCLARLIYEYEFSVFKGMLEKHYMFFTEDSVGVALDRSTFSKNVVCYVKLSDMINTPTIVEPSAVEREQIGDFAGGIPSVLPLSLINTALEISTKIQPWPHR